MFGVATGLNMGIGAFNRACVLARRLRTVPATAGFVSAALAIAMTVFPAVALGQDAGSVAKKRGATDPKNQGSDAVTQGVFAKKQDTIILPWFSQGLQNDEPTATTNGNALSGQPANGAGTNAGDASIIQLPSFAASTPSNAFAPQSLNAAPGPFPKKHKKNKHVPEIDAASMANALALLVGGMLILTDRRRRPAATSR